jgi:hypothetical protein
VSTRRVDTPDTYASLDDREQDPPGPPPGLEQAREVRAVAYARDGEVDRADARVPAPVAVPVGAGQAVLGSRSPLGRPVSSVTSASMTAWASTHTLSILS